MKCKNPDGIRWVSQNDGCGSQNIACYSIAMGDDSATVVICEACGDRAAEIVAEDRRALCSECHLAENGAKTPPEEKPARGK